MIKDIKKWIIIAISFAGTLWLIWAVYGAWVSMSTVSNWQTLDASLINNIIANQNDLNTRVSWTSIPTWFIWSFNLASCPTWWIVADWTNSTPDLRWAFVRWIWWDANSRDIARTLWDYQTDDFKSHSHRLDSVTIQAYSFTPQVSNYYAPAKWAWATIDNWPTTANVWWTETRPKNIALLYCQKL